MKTKALIATAVLGIGLSGCTGPAIVIDPAPYAGPAMRIEAGERDHVAVFTMPTGGWGLRFDRVRERYDAQEVFLTLRKPGANEAATQALVEQRVDTRVRLGRGVEVYARIEEMGAEKGGYRRVGGAEGK